MNQAPSESAPISRLSPTAEQRIELLRQQFEDFVFAGALHLNDDGVVIGSDGIGRHLLRGSDLTRPLAPNLSLPTSEAIYVHWHQAQQHPQFFTVCFKHRPQRLLCALVDRTQKELGALVLIREGSAESLHPHHPISEAMSLWSRAIGDALWVWDFNTNHASFSPRWHELFALQVTPTLATLDAWMGRLSNVDAQTFTQHLTALSLGQQDHFEVEQCVELSSGASRWLLVRAYAEHHPERNLARVVGTVTDITNHKRESERMLYESHHDLLTGLPNRLGFKYLAANPSSTYGARPQSSALILIGIGELSLINDSLGPAISDQLVTALSKRIQSLIKPDTLLARLTNDEFLLLLRELPSQEHLQLLTEQLSQELNQPFDLAGRSVCASVSMGIVSDMSTHYDLEELISDASLALLEARRNGGGENILFTPSMRTANARRLMLEPELRRSIERQELLLAYQPIISLSSGNLLGFEALCRWKHHEHGFIGPDEFIPLAEDNGLIRHIGAWVLRKACDEALTWPSLPSGQPPWVAVNVSGRQLTHPHFVAEIRTLLAETKFPPERLHLELTESVLMDNPDIARAVLNDLRALGIHLSIDDFGTGYSSLAYLRNFPIGTLKIDRAFLSKGPQQESSWTIIETIQALATALNIDVVVEGVETLEHINRLRRMGCHGAQGYLLSRPIPSDQLPPYMSELRVGCVPVNTHCAHD